VKPIGEKRGKDTYQNIARSCLLQDGIIIEQVRKFSQWARAFMCAYLALEKRSRSREENEQAQ
jgi:hypothetical protein